MSDYFYTHTLKGWGAMSPAKFLPKFVGDLYGLYPKDPDDDVSPKDFEAEIASMKQALFNSKN